MSVDVDVHGYPWIWISMDIHRKSVDMDMDMDVKFHIHGNPAKVRHRQASATTECRCSRLQRHPQVRPRSVSSATRAAALTRCSSASANSTQLEMWANAQRDGRPAEYRWHPLFNAAKFG